MMLSLKPVRSHPFPLFGLFIQQVYSWSVTLLVKYVAKPNELSYFSLFRTGCVNLSANRQQLLPYILWEILNSFDSHKVRLIFLCLRFPKVSSPNWLKINLFCTQISQFVSSRFNFMWLLQLLSRIQVSIVIG